MIGVTEIQSSFEAAAGISPDEMSLLIRSILCALFLLWAVWTIYGKFQLVQKNMMDIHDFPMNVFRVLVLCSLVVSLVFIA